MHGRLHQKIRGSVHRKYVGLRADEVKHIVHAEFAHTLLNRRVICFGFGNGLSGNDYFQSGKITKYFGRGLDQHVLAFAFVDAANHGNARLARSEADARAQCVNRFLRN